MAYPEAIQKKKEANDLYWKKIADAEAAANPNAEVTTQTVTPNQVQVIQAQPETVIETVNTEQVQPVYQDFSQDPNQDLSQNPSEETWQHKYSTLQGIFNKKVRDAQIENQNLSASNANLEATLTTLSNQTTLTAPVEEPLPEITAGEQEYYGDSVDFMRKVTRKELAPLRAQMAEMQRALNQIKSDVVPQVAQVSQVQQSTGERMFYEDLSARVPNWQEINLNPEFHSWLLGDDPMSGVSRQTFLEDAQRNLDSARVAGFFTSWSNGGTYVAPALINPNPRQPSQLEMQIAPGAGRAPGSITQTEAPKYFTRAEIKQFYNNAKKGLYTPEDKERFSNDIDLAISQGRITQ